MALQVEPMEGSDSFAVRGRGVLHLSVLIETMRREGYELAVGKPRVINRDNQGQQEEPFETLVVEVARGINRNDQKKFTAPHSEQ